jgi:hypothetical protein
VRPRLGSACTQPGLECDYQACGTYGGDFLCDGGVWAEGQACFDWRLFATRSNKAQS